MTPLKMYRDADEAPRAEADVANPHAGALAQFLESDVQDDPELCEDLIATIEELDLQDDPLEIVGNSYALIFDGETVALDCVADDETDDIFTLSRDYVIEELKNWKEFLG